MFHYKTWLGLPQNALGLCEQASWMHTHLVSFVELSYTYSSSASVAWQSLLLALTSTDGHLHSSLMWDFLLFCLLHNHHSIPPIVLCPWLTLTYCVKVEKVWEHQKYETVAWLVIGVVHDESILVWRKWSMTKLYDFVGMNFLWPCYFEKT